jgi:large subunit ribosomal protein L16
MLRPNQRKFRKNNKGRFHAKFETKANILKFGTHGIQALEKGRITAKQIEAVRRSITNFLKRKGKVWIRIFPDFPVTNKPSEVRMGKGKGNVSYWVCNVRPGRILYELAGPDYKLLLNALKYASVKLPIGVKILTRKFL